VPWVFGTIRQQFREFVVLLRLCVLYLSLITDASGRIIQSMAIKSDNQVAGANMGGRIRFALERFGSPRHSSHVAQLFSLGVQRGQGVARG